MPRIKSWLQTNYLVLGILGAILGVEIPLAVSFSRQLQYINKYVTYQRMEDGLIYSRLSILNFSGAALLLPVLGAILLLLIFISGKRKRLGLAIAFALQILVCLTIGYQILANDTVTIFSQTHALNSVELNGYTYNLAFKNNNELGSSYYIFKCRGTEDPCEKIASFYPYQNAPTGFSLPRATEASLKLNDTPNSLDVIFGEANIYHYTLDTDSP